jgi:hypothetical protein
MNHRLVSYCSSLYYATDTIPKNYLLIKLKELTELKFNLNGRVMK